MKTAAIPVLAIACWLPVSMAVAQSAGDSKAPAFDPAKSGVKVIFAPQKAQAPAPSAAAGQRAHVDPQGKLKDADPEESQKLSDQLKALFSRPVENLVPIYGPGSSVGVNLGEEFMVAATATIGPDGKIQFNCGPAAQAKQSVENAAPVSKSVEKEASDVR